MIIREHYVPKDAHCCIHCGAINPGAESTCVSRWIEAAGMMRPEPARRVDACEDSSIAGRITELTKEREAGWNRSG